MFSTFSTDLITDTRSALLTFGDDPELEVISNMKRDWMIMQKELDEPEARSTRNEMNFIENSTRLWN